VTEIALALGRSYHAVSGKLNKVKHQRNRMRGLT